MVEDAGCFGQPWGMRVCMEQMIHPIFGADKITLPEVYKAGIRNGLESLTPIPILEVMNRWNVGVTFSSSPRVWGS